MKKNLLVGLVLVLGAILSGCKFSQIVDGDGMEREIQYPIAEQECIDNNGEITTNGEGIPICLFSENEYCYLEDMEDGGCDLLYSQGGEWITVVTDICEEQGGVVEHWLEGGDKQDVCYFDDKTFCYLEDFAAGNCKKGDMSYINDGVVYDYPPEDQLNGKPMEEAFCDYNAGVITENEYGDRFCTFSDGGYYELRAFKELGEMPSLRGPDEPYCSDFEDIVCGTDGNSYVNECWMKSAGVEEEIELAEVVDGECVFG